MAYGASAGHAIDFHPPVVVKNHRGNAADLVFGGDRVVGSPAGGQVDLDSDGILLQKGVNRGIAERVTFERAQDWAPSTRPKR